MKQPKVSVIIPVYNTEPYLRQCLDSVVNQTLRDIEIICVDDGSTDGSLSILKEYEQKDLRVTVIRQPNEGQSSARNNGMGRARGEYIDFLDSDDYLTPDALGTALRAAEENDLDILLFEREPFYETEELAQNPFRIKHITKPTAVMTGVQYVKTAKDRGTYVVTPWIALWRRAFLTKHGIAFPNGIIHEDNLFSFRAYMAAERLMRIPDKFYCRRVREGSTMTSPVSAKNVIGYFSCAMGVMQYGLRDADPDKEREIRREYARMLGAARRDYAAISDEERKKAVFPSEMENELFLHLTKEWFDLKASGEAQKARADRFREDLGSSQKEAAALHRALQDGQKEADALRRALQDGQKEADALRRALQDSQKEADNLRRDLEKQRKRADTLQHDLDCVHRSASFRIGRAVTWLPRKIRGGVRCLRDHGLGYTFRRLLYHMGLRKDEEEQTERKNV